MNTHPAALVPLCLTALEQLHLLTVYPAEENQQHQRAELIKEFRQRGFSHREAILWLAMHCGA